MKFWTGIPRSGAEDMPEIIELFGSPTDDLLRVFDGTSVLEINANHEWSDAALQAVMGCLPLLAEVALRIPSVGEKSDAKIKFLRDRVSKIRPAAIVLESLNSKAERNPDDSSDRLPKREQGSDPALRAARAVAILDAIAEDPECQMPQKIWIGGTDAAQDVGKLGDIYDPFDDWMANITVFESHGYEVLGIVQALPYKRLDPVLSFEMAIVPFADLSRRVKRELKRDLVWIPTVDDSPHFLEEVRWFAENLCEAIPPRHRSMLGLSAWKRPLGIPDQKSWWAHCAKVITAQGNE